VLQVQVICFAGGAAAAAGKNGISSPRSLFQHPAPSVGQTLKNISAPLNLRNPFLSSKNELQQFLVQKFT